MTDSDFELYWTQLTESQLQAAEWGDGPYLLLAGPGSGKTRVLTARLGRLLNESAGERFQILALTFTNQAALEMMERLDSISDSRAERSFVGTFHSFCAEVLRHHGAHVGVQPDFDILIEEADRQREFRRALQSDKARAAVENLEERGIKPLPLIDKLKQLGLPPGESAKKFKNKEIAASVITCYEAYDQQLRKQNRLDFNTILFKAYELVSSFPGVCKILRAIYRYWALDEFQDTNSLQYSIVKSIAGEKFKNLFVVADEDQIIYQWNGASYQRMQQYIEDFEPEVFQLPTNFRCPAEVVGIANKLIQHNRFRHEGKKLLVSGVPRSNVVASDAICLEEFDTGENEAQSVAERIDENWGSEQSVGVLARNKYLLEPVKDALSELGRKSRIVQSRNDFVSPQYRLIYRLLRLCVRNQNEDILRDVVESLNAFLDVPIELQNVIARAKARDQDVFSALIGELDTSDDQQVPPTDWRGLLTSLGNRDISPSEFVNQAIELMFDVSDQSGGVDTDIAEDEQAWNSLRQEIRAVAGSKISLDRFLQELDMRSKEPPLSQDEIALMTIHASKGREFDDVYLIGVAEDILPSWHSKKKSDSSPEMEEERRNCFVAITRTKKTLNLSYAKKYGTWRRQPSRFLHEMELI